MTLVTIKKTKRDKINKLNKLDRDIIKQIEIENHTGFSADGYDIVCAAVSSATELVINTVTEFFLCECEVKVTEEPPKIFLRISDDFDSGEKLFAVSGLLDGFAEHLENISKNYPGNLRVEIIED